MTKDCINNFCAGGWGDYDGFGCCNFEDAADCWLGKANTVLGTPSFTVPPITASAGGGDIFACLVVADAISSCEIATPGFNTSADADPYHGAACLCSTSGSYA